MFLLGTGFALRTSIHTNTSVKREQDLYFATENTLKQNLTNLQLVIRQQDQAFDKQCILPVNKAEVAVSGKSSSYINYYITDMCHKTHHYPDSAYSFSSITSFNP